MRVQFALAVLAMAGAASTAAFADSACNNITGNLVVNCGFEAGSFTSVWTVGNPSDPFTFVDNVGVHSGNYNAELGSFGQDNTISQTISTIAGKDYTFSFWLANEKDAAVPPGLNDFSASWGGDTVFSVTNDTEHNFQEHTFVVTATSSSTVIQFAERNDDVFFHLDDVSVVASEPIIWPGSLLGLGLLGVCARRLRPAQAQA